EGPRARMRGEADHSRVPGAIGADDARSPWDAGAHARRRGKLARATPGAARRRLEEGAAARRLPDGAGAYRSLASRRVPDESLARDARRRSAREHPRSRARIRRTISALVLRAPHPLA